MVSAIDIGEDNDLHPQNKKELGRRLAKAAEGLVFGEATEYMGPILKNVRSGEKKIYLTFEHVGEGICAKNGQLSHFAVVDADDRIYEVTPVIEKNDKGLYNILVINVSEIREPKTVTYAWANAPGVIDFYNTEGLPASPFRAVL